MVELDLDLEIRIGPEHLVQCGQAAVPFVREIGLVILANGFDPGYRRQNLCEIDAGFGSRRRPPKTGVIKTQFQDMEATRPGTARERGGRIRVGCESNAEISTAGPTRFIADAAVNGNPPKNAMFLRENRHHNDIAELFEDSPESVDGVQKTVGIVLGKRFDAIRRNGTELVEDGIDLPRAFLAARSEPP